LVRPMILLLAGRIGRRVVCARRRPRIAREVRRRLPGSGADNAKLHLHRDVRIGFLCGCPGCRNGGRLRSLPLYITLLCAVPPDPMHRPAGCQSRGQLAKRNVEDKMQDYPEQELGLWGLSFGDRVGDDSELKGLRIGAGGAPTRKSPQGVGIEEPRQMPRCRRP
jgi:hypothetical protein